MYDGTMEIRVDGESSDAQVPELELLGERVGSNHGVGAERIDGNYWEVQANAL